MFTSLVIPNTAVKGWRFSPDGGILLACLQCGAVHQLGDDYTIDQESGEMRPEFVCLNVRCDYHAITTLSRFADEYHEQIERCIHALDLRKPRVVK